MRVMSLTDLSKVSGGVASLYSAQGQTIIKVTGDSKFTYSGRINGVKLDAVVLANDFQDINGNSLGYDLSQPFMHNGQMIIPQAIEGGRLYILT